MPRAMSVIFGYLTLRASSSPCAHSSNFNTLASFGVDSIFSDSSMAMFSSLATYIDYIALRSQQELQYNASFNRNNPWNCLVTIFLCSTDRAIFYFSQTLQWDWLSINGTFCLCDGCSKSPNVEVSGRSKASSVIVRSNSGKTSGISCTRCARWVCAKHRASSMVPARISSIRYSCYNLKWHCM